MPIVIAEDWIESVGELSQSDYKRTHDFFKKFRSNPANPGISLERVESAKDPNLWSARITQGLRAILHKDADVWTLLYAGQHDDAYRWAENRQIQRHKITGALQIVASTHLVEEIIERRNTSTPGLFDGHADDYLMSLGLPDTWLPTIRKVNSEDVLFEVVERLPADVAERLIDVANGKLVTPPTPLPAGQSVFESEDTRRRFVMLEDNLEMLDALEAPLARWVSFLHPSQRKLAEWEFNGPVKVTGSAGTGKTVVAMHRARNLARQDKRVLVTSYVNTLCHNIKGNIQMFCNDDERSRITVSTVHAQAREVLNLAGENVRPVDDEQIKAILEELYWDGCPLDPGSLFAEWENIIQAHAVRSWEQYRDVSRKGRGRSLNAKERKLVWEVFEKLLEDFKKKKILDWSSMCLRAKELVEAGTVKSKYDTVIVDEVQDLRALELMFVSALAGSGKNRLMLIGDGGQRIYANKLSLKSLGIDVRGRSHILRINYRTTEQIRKFADSLLRTDVDDMDESVEDRSDTKSLLRGPRPTLKSFKTKAEQYDFIATKIKELTSKQLKPGEIAVFSRKCDLVENIFRALTETGLCCKQLTKDSDIALTDSVYVGTMHRAKGLEFKVVFVADVSADTVPLGFAVKMGKDPMDFREALERERQLLYVSITRARDEVYITWSGAPSEFLVANQSLSVLDF